LKRALLALVVACGSSQPRELPHFGVPFATGPVAGDGSGSATGERGAVVDDDGKVRHDDDGFHFEPTPGCTEVERKARAAELQAMSDAVAQGSADPKAVLGELHAELAKPCLDYLAPAVALPASVSREHLHDAFFHDGFGDALMQAADGIRAKGGVRAIIVPPEIVPDLAGSDAAAIAPLACAGSDASCARTASYVTRAEAAFDARYDKDRKNVLPVEACDGSQLKEDDEIKWPHTLEDFVSCAAVETSTTLRFAAPTLRAPEHGWLILRGRRGHYDWADELRAYDLATGAAYVVRHTGQIIVDNGKPHGDDAYTGRLAPDQVRELTFMLLARRAFVPVRTWTTKATVPSGIPIALPPAGTPPPDPEKWPHLTWADDGQTEIAYAYVDGAARVQGTFTWPAAADWRDTYLDELLAVAEAGLVRDCAPAKLPATSVLIGPAGSISQIDASRAEQDAEDHALDALAETLRSKACRGAR
jgi:hypothetical protein